MSSSRQLAVIMFTDIVGYTALMGKDSQKALEIVRQSLAIQKPLVEKYQGKWLKEIGDGAMAQFGSALDAVNCALEIQRNSRADFEADLRIGIHLGDITFENEEVYGDGVNIASRLQSIADPGGIYISESVEKAIRGQGISQARYLGEIKLKNVNYDVRTYALQGVGLPVPEILSKKELSGHLWAELQRRGVIRAGIAYVAISLLLLVLIPYAQTLVTLPDWTFQVVLIFLLVGFPIALYLAWNFERSPQGFVRTSSRQSWQNPYSASQRKPLTGSVVIAALLGIIALMYFLPQAPGQQIRVSTTAAAANDDLGMSKSIAILPFRNLSADPEQVYFAEGVAEMIRANLSKVADLQVTSMRSVMQYADSEKTIPQIGSELNVGNVLEGSVLKEGNQVRVIVQLIDVGSDKHLWSETYDQDLTGIFEIQTNVAQKIAQELEAQLTQEEGKRVSEAKKVSLEAYQLFLLGTHNLQSYQENRDSILNETAIQRLKEALEIEPEFALAWGSLSNALLYRPGYGWGDQWYDTAFQTAEKALALDPEESTSYFIKGYIQGIKGQEEKAISNYKKAIALNPNYALATRQLGQLYMFQQEYEKGLPLLVKSLQLDPLVQGEGINEIIGDIYLWAGMNEKAEAYYRKEVALQPSIGNFIELDFALWGQGKWDEAKSHLSIYQDVDYTKDFNLADGVAWHHWMAGDLETAEKIYVHQLQRFENDYQESFRHHTFRHRLAYIWLRQGKQKEAEQLLKENIAQLKDQSEDEFAVGGTTGGSYYDIAGSYLMLGEKELAYEWLEKMPNDLFINMLIKVDPMFASLSQEPRFQKILDRVYAEERKIKELLQELELEQALNNALRM